MSCTPLPKAAKPVWAKQLTRLPCLVVYAKFQFVHSWFPYKGLKEGSSSFSTNHIEFGWAEWTYEMWLPKWTERELLLPLIVLKWLSLHDLLRQDAYRSITFWPDNQQNELHKNWHFLDTRFLINTKACIRPLAMFDTCSSRFATIALI